MQNIIKEDTHDVDTVHRVSTLQVLCVCLVRVFGVCLCEGLLFETGMLIYVFICYMASLI